MGELRSGHPYVRHKPEKQDQSLELTSSTHLMTTAVNILVTFTLKFLIREKQNFIHGAAHSPKSFLVFSHSADRADQAATTVNYFFSPSSHLYYTKGKNTAFQQKVTALHAYVLDL